MSPESGLNSWFQRGRVEMRIARLRALTPFIVRHNNADKSRRNEDCPTEGIDTNVIMPSPPIVLLSRNEDCPTEGIDTPAMW